MHIHILTKLFSVTYSKKMINSQKKKQKFIDVIWLDQTLVISRELATSPPMPPIIKQNCLHIVLSKISKWVQFRNWEILDQESTCLYLAILLPLKTKQSGNPWALAYSRTVTTRSCMGWITLPWENNNNWIINNNWIPTKFQNNK